MLVEIHMIQNHAPSNLNRDDTGSPKEALFGGVMRARISSQCIKRSIRRSPIFEGALRGHLATRTRRLPVLLKDELLNLGCTEEEAALVARKASAFGSGKEGDSETRQLIFLDPDEVEALSVQLKGILDAEGAKKFSDLKIDDIEKRLSTRPPRSVDVAMFGRMTTSATFDDVDAAIQVAHAISTGKVEKQFDYFTAIDDLVEAADESGAGMIGDVEFNSATYYKYFALDWDAFVSNLGDDRGTAGLAVGAFIKAAALTTPTGKQNTFAAFNPPDAILVEMKNNRVPINYANAFLKPVRAQGGQDVVELSIKALSEYGTSLKAAYAIKPYKSVYLSVRGEAIANSQRLDDIDSLVEEVLGVLSKEVEGEVVAS